MIIKGSGTILQIGIDILASYPNWSKLYEALPDNRRSPFFSPEYHQAYKEIDPAPAICFWAYRDDENYLFYPFLKKSINALGYDLEGEFFDISGAYNYNGPLGKVSDPAFCAEYNAQLQEFLLAENIVTEFVRYCPVTNNRIFHLYTEQFDVLDNVYIDLSHSIDTIWESTLTSAVRRAVNKGTTYGLESVIKYGSDASNEELNEFWDIYISTMNRNGADDYYYFDKAFIKSLIEQLKQHVILAITYLDNQPTTCELLLTDGSLAFGFLGGTLSQFFSVKANSFQRWELIKYLKEIGLTRYSIGGGASRHDSIYRFKLSFAKDCDNPFFVGTKVHLPSIYDSVLLQWATKNPSIAAKYSSRIQGYRLQG